jgi:oligopeptide transport system permease protein
VTLTGDGFPVRITLDSQYTNFVLDALRGDLGVSFRLQDRPVTQAILNTFKVSAVLGTLAVVMACSVGVCLGVMAALHRNGPIDYASVVLGRRVRRYQVLY